MEGYKGVGLGEGRGDFIVVKVEGRGKGVRGGVCVYKFSLEK